MQCEEAQELITGLVDGELSAHESRLIEAHFGECPECPKSFSREHALKRLVKGSAMSIRTPAELRGSILRDRRRQTRRAWRNNIWEILPSVRAMAVQGAALALVLALPIFTARYWLQSPHFPIVPGVFQSYRQIVEGEIIPLNFNSVAELKTGLSRLVGGELAPMAYDFSSMDIHLAGGLLQQIANRKVLVAVYRGNELTIICYTFIGSDEDAPEVAEMFFDVEKGMPFHQFHYPPINAVMHREGDINCILVSQMPMPDLLTLARAKAHSS